MNVARCITLIASCLLLVVLVSSSLVVPPPAKAIPLYARRYGVTCETCHSVPPKLTKFGLAFQSNYYNWPGDNPPAYHAGFTIFPFSGLVAYNSQSGQQLTNSTDFRTVQLQFSDGFRLASKHNGGYYIELNTAARGNVPHAGDFGRAVVSVPLAGPQGQLSLSAGQFAPFGYQWDGMANLTSFSQPTALNDNFALNTDLDGVTFDADIPDVRLEWYDHRDQMTADGNYVNIGVPYGGALTTRSNNSWSGPRGVYAHAFRRNGFTTYGLFGYAHGGHQLGSLVGTQQIGEKLYLLDVASVGRDAVGNHHHFSLQADYVCSPILALTGRLDNDSADNHQVYPVLAFTYYPGKQYWLRLTGETVLQPGNRTTTIQGLVQF